MLNLFPVLFTVTASLGTSNGVIDAISNSFHPKALIFTVLSNSIELRRLQ